MFRTMGEGSKLSGAGQAQPFASRPRAAARMMTAARQHSARLGIDVPLLLIVLTLIIFGLVMLYSASYDYSLTWYGDSARIFQRQLIWLAIGLVVSTILVIWDYHSWSKLAVPMIVTTLVGLVAVLLVNNVRNNAVRTLWGGSVQPSEAAKLVIIIYLAVWLFSKRDQLSDITLGLIPLGLILGLFGGLIYIQPDLSAAMTIFMLGGVLFFLAGGDLRQIAAVVIIGLAAGWIIVQVSSTGSTRVAEYLAGIQDPAQASYHVRRSLEAFVNGGWFGVGIGQADTKLTGLPGPPTDSIFAVVGEELGVVGASGLVLLYAAMFWRGMTIAQRAPDGLGALLAAGLSIWIAFEAFVNMAVMVNLLPFAGNALPLISAGGSNLVVTLAGIGILLNISRRSVLSQEENGRLFRAVVDLRRWDRRGRVPRARRTTGIDR